MIKSQKKKSSASASVLGRLGGRAIVRKRGNAYMRKIGKKGADARWHKNSIIH